MLGLGFFQHRQLIQRLQAQIVQKLARGGKQCRAAHGFPVANDFNPAAIFKLLDDQTVHGHAANVFNITTRNGLTVGNDGQRLQRGTRVFGRLFGVQLIQIHPHFGAALKTPARSHLHQFHALEGPVLLQVQQQILDRVRAQHIIKK